MSTIVTDTITGKSTATTITIGSTPVVSASANSLTIRGEGSAQTSIQQGLTKVWADYPGAASSITDSFNVATITDSSAGVSTINFTNNFAAVAYSCTRGDQLAASSGTGIFYANPFGRASSSCGASHFENGSNVDPSNYSAQFTGDLA